MNMKVNSGLISADVPQATIENKEMKGSETKMCFEQMDAFAKSFGKELAYEIR